MAYVRLKAHGISDTGLVRTNNEDAWFVSVQESLFLVADGLGGHQAGEVASKEAIEKFCEIFLAEKELMKLSKCDTSPGMMIEHPILSYMRVAVEETNNSLHALSTSHGLLKGMGTTLLALHIMNERAFICHVGDSRLYRIRKSHSLEQITKDHLISYPLAKSLPREKEACQGQKGYLTKAIGTQPSVEPDLFSVPVYDGDIFLMCSDGLSDMVDERDIESTLEMPLTIEQKVRMLVSLAKENGGVDNITVLLVEVVSS